MRAVLFTLVVFFYMTNKTHAIEIYDELPEACEVIESFTLFSNSSSSKVRARELEKEVVIKFTGVIFDEKLYLTQRTVEEQKHKEWLDNQPSNLIVDPNFYGIPKGVQKHNGILVRCNETET